MAKETWFDAQDALAQGFADRLVEPVHIAARFDIGRFRNAPPKLVEGETDADTGDAEDGADIATEEEIPETAEGDPVPRSEPDVGDANIPSTEKGHDSSVAVVITAPDAAAIRTEAIAHARAIIDLCRLAGQPEMAGRFLEQDVGLDEVRAALLAAKAEAEPEITAHHPQPGRSSATRPWGEIVARTFRSKG